MTEQIDRDDSTARVTHSEQRPEVHDIDFEKAETGTAGPQLNREQSHISNHDLHGVVSPDVEADAAQYERFSSRRKVIITWVVSLCGFLAPFSSTTVLAAIPEVAAEYNTSGSVIGISNALYLVFMGISPCFWGPMSQIYGRRWVRERRPHILQEPDSTNRQSRYASHQLRSSSASAS